MTRRDHLLDLHALCRRFDLCLHLYLLAAGARMVDRRCRVLGLRGDLIRVAAAALAALLLALPARAVHAQDPGLSPNPHHEAARIIAAELAMDQASADLDSIAAQQPSGLMESMRKELAMDRASYSLRAAARQEVLRVYELAGYASVESAVVRLLPPALQNPVENTIAGLHLSLIHISEPTRLGMIS